MNEIEKLYKNAGIELVADVKFPTKDVNYNVSYPPFTTEKQLEIIKLISKQGQVTIENWETDNRGFNIVFRANSNLRYITFDSITRQTFEEALAQIVNDIWQDLTPEEKTSIKNILEI